MSSAYIDSPNSYSVFDTPHVIIINDGLDICFKGLPNAGKPKISNSDNKRMLRHAFAHR